MATLTCAQAIQMLGDSTLPLNSGVVFQVLDDGTVSVVDPSNGSTNVVGVLPKSAMVSSSKVGFKRQRLSRTIWN